MQSPIIRSECKKPVLLVGNGARSAGAAGLVREFAHKTGIPVLTTMNGVDLAQDDLHVGFIGTHGNRVANMILQECDLVVSVGARLGIRQVGRTAKRFAPRARLVRCDIDEYELSRNIKENEQKFHGDARDFMRLLLGETTGDYSGWKAQCMEAKAVLEPCDKQPGNRAVEKIASLLPPDPVVSVDVGMNQCWCAQSLVLKGYEGRIHISGSYGTMGCGLPFAIGSCIALGNAVTYCIAGDGGFQMNIQELETVRRERLPIKIFILNNRELGKISETQYFNLDGRSAYTTAAGGYTVPDFSKIAGAYGIRAAKLADCGELDVHASWIADGEPCLFDIALPEHSLLTPKIRFETQTIRPELDGSVIAKVEEILRR